MGIRKREHVTDEELSLLIDGMLDERTSRRVQTHLQQCDACHQRYEELRQTVVLLHKVPRVSVPRAFTLTEADVTGRARQRGRALPWMRWATALVAAMLVAVVGLDLLTASILGSSGTAAPPPKMALQAERMPPTPSEVQPAKPALAPAARAANPQPMLRAQGGAEAEATSLSRPTAVVEVTPVPQQKSSATPAPSAPSETGWPWYRWTEIVLLGVLLLLLIFQVVLK